MPEFLFKFVGNCPLPVFDTDHSGTVRVADGKTIFTLRQASRKARRPAKELRELFTATIRELMSSAEQPSIEPGTEEAVTGNAGTGESAADDTATGESAELPPDVQAAMALQPDQRYRLAVRRVICGHLSEEHFEDFMAICRARNLDPLKRQIYPRTQFDEDTKQLEVIGETTIDGFRAIASRDPRFDGLRGPYFRAKEGEWQDSWNDDDVQPYAAKAVVLIKRRLEPVVAIVKWNEFAPYTIEKGQIIYDEFWRKMPSHMLGKVAQAQAYRMGLPESLGGLYIGEELAAIERERKQLAIEATERELLEDWDDSLPQTLNKLKLQLMDDFNLSQADAEHRIQLHRDRYPQTLKDNEAQFCATVYKAVRSHERRKGNVMSHN